jgi:hypothetical protein
MYEGMVKATNLYDPDAYGLEQRVADIVPCINARGHREDCRGICESPRAPFPAILESTIPGGGGVKEQ